MDLLIDRLSQFGGKDALEVAIIAYLLYRLLLLIRRTRAVRMAWGLVILAMFGLVARAAQFETLDWLLSNVAAYIVIAIIVLFQNEIRRLLTSLGRTAYFRSMRGGEIDPIDEIVTAVTALASERQGAIVVFEREMSLAQYADAGISLDAEMSYDLLVSIFNPAAPLHDGAVIVRCGRLAAAACFLPLTLNPRLSRELGSRHRAAIGISEETDAVTVVVSEESGKVSMVVDGRLSRGLDGDELADGLRRTLGIGQPEEEEEPGEAGGSAEAISSIHAEAEETATTADSLGGSPAPEGVGK